MRFHACKNMHQQGTCFYASGWGAPAAINSISVTAEVQRSVKECEEIRKDTLCSMSVGKGDLDANYANRETDCLNDFLMYAPETARFIVRPRSAWGGWGRSKPFQRNNIQIPKMYLISRQVDISNSGPHHSWTTDEHRSYGGITVQ